MASAAEGGPSGRTGLLDALTEMDAAFDLGQAAPDPVRLAGRQRIGETLLANEATGTDLLGLVLSYAPLRLGLAVVGTEEEDGRIGAASRLLSPLGFRRDIVKDRLAHDSMLPGIAASVNGRAGNCLGSVQASQ